MKFAFPSTIGLAAVLTTVLCQNVPGQAAQGQTAQSPEAQSRDAQSIPPRASPADYQARAQAGAFTVAAEFTGHSVATPEAVLSTEDYVAVEVGIFGPPNSRLKLSYQDFALRINGKKTPVPAEEYAAVFQSLKDPNWSPPEQAEEKKSKGGLSTGAGGDGSSSSPPPIVHVPIALKREMQLRVQKAALSEGERRMPEAGLIFFPHRGKTENLRSIELIYNGPAGKASLTLHP